jgi:hypothetical protein
MLLISDLSSKSAVKIGNTFFPPNTVENILKLTCKQVMVHTNNPDFPYQLLGSMTCIKINGRYFGICTGHQIIEDQFKDTSIFIFEKNATVLPSNTYTFTCDEPDLSLIFFEFSDAVNEFEFIRNNFFKANISEIWPIKERNHFIIFGFPSKFQEISEKYETKTALISAKYHKKSNAPYAHIVEIKGNMKINADGMSGGPVYYMGGHPGDYFIGWAGMIVRGGNPSEKLYFIEAGFIFERLLELTAQKNPKN